jgi:large subunit ribosomal protein L19
MNFICNFVTLFFDEGKMNKLDFVKNLIKEKTDEIRKNSGSVELSNIPNFKAGDVVNVAVRVVEGDKERIQNFKGIVLYRRGEGPNQTFCVRKVSNGVGVERIFPLYSPMIQSITVLQSSRVRRARLFYLRGMSERKIRQKLRAE